MDEHLRTTCPLDLQSKPMPSSSVNPVGRTVYAVSELAEILRALLEDSLPDIWVQGEISNFSRPASGHWYFTLKDARAQLRCAMFRGNNYLIRPQPKNGDEVLLRGRVSLYPGRGELQLICEYMEPAGTGALLRAFEALKQKLAAEGLFDTAHKRPLPTLPRRIGIITSGTGAALQDILTALRRRWPLAEVLLWPVPVQGAAAAPAIVKALADLPRRAPMDLILLARGGGSLEDLWAFNEESVARAIHACSVPVVSGVGHETDTTIADFVADLRAATPTAAAELASPDRADWLQRVVQQHRRLRDSLRLRLDARQQELSSFERRLQLLHPGRRLLDRAQRLDDFETRIRQSIIRLLQSQHQRLLSVVRQLGLMQPTERLALAQQRLDAANRKLEFQILQRLLLRHQRLDHADALLNSLSPAAVLGRGYALAMDREGRILRDAARLTLGQVIDLQLARGRAEAEIRRLPEEN